MVGWASGWVQSPSTMVTGEKFMGLLWTEGYFGPDPKPSSGVVPLHTTVRVSAVLSQRKIPLPVLIKGEKKKKREVRKPPKKAACALGVWWGILGGQPRRRNAGCFGLCLRLRGRRRRRVAAPCFVCRESLLRVWQDGSNLIRRGLD